MKMNMLKVVLVVLFALFVMNSVVIVYLALQFKSDIRVAEYVHDMETSEHDERITAILSNIEEHEKDFDRQFEETKKELQDIEFKIEELRRGYELIYDTKGRLFLEHVDDDKIIELTNITTSFNVLQPSSITAYELDMILEGSGLEGLGKEYIAVEMNYGINALFMVCKDIHESSWGNSDLAKYKDNISGYKAYDHDPYNSATDFTDIGGKPACIRTVANSLLKNYLTEGGDYHYGYTIQSINRSYASDNNWGNSIARLMRDLNEKIIESTN